MSDDYITTCDCDGCGDKSVPCVMMHHNGTPVLAECRHCAPNIFESVAREDIDQWLAGGVFRGGEVFHLTHAA